MFNTYQFNTYQFNTWPASVVSSSFPLLKYNWHSFGTTNIRVARLPTIESVTDIEHDTYKIANDHGMGEYGRHIRSKTVSVEWIISADTASELESVISAFKAAIVKSSKTLYYKRQDNRVIRTTATLRNLSIDREYFHLTFVPFNVDFVSLEPFFYANSWSEEVFAGRSTNFSWSINYTEGNFRAEPSIYITFLTGLSSVTTITVTLNGKTITLTHNASNGDSIIFDCKSKDVLINGSGWNDYTGEFPSLAIWSNAFEIDIDGTWNADINFTRYDTYV